MTACKWDVVIPFDLLWEQYKRIIKPNGAIALFGSQPFTSALVMSNPKWFKYEWIWDKYTPSGFFNASYRPLKQHENICVFSEGKSNYNPQKFLKPYKAFRSGLGYTKVGQSSKIGAYGEYAKGTGVRSEYSNPKTIIQFKTGNGYDKKNNVHPTQKPVKLIEYLIKTYTQEGELILDNTAGSGTLAIAAINTNRQYICIEKDEHSFEVMRSRIENHDPNAPIKTKKPKPVPKGQLTLFGDDVCA